MVPTANPHQQTQKWLQLSFTEMKLTLLLMSTHVLLKLIDTLNRFLKGNLQHGAHRVKTQFGSCVCVLERVCEFVYTHACSYRLRNAHPSWEGGGPSWRGFREGASVCMCMRVCVGVWVCVCMHMCVCV